MSHPDSLEIKTLRSGAGPAGAPMALLEAPQNASPGSMESLTRFLNIRGIRALPGYSGADRRHVLRLSGFENDAWLVKLLQREFPLWQREHAQDASLYIAPDLKVMPLEKDPALEKNESTIKRYLKTHNHMLTGLVYTASNLALLLSGIGNHHTHLPPSERWDKLKVASAAGYLTASSIFLAVGHKTHDPRKISEILKEVYPTSGESGNNAFDKAREDHTGRVMHFLKTHPWETMSLIGASSAAMHLASTIRRRRTIEAASAVGTMVAMLLPALVREKDGRGLLGGMDSMVPDARWEHYLDSLEEFKRHHSFLAPMASVVQAISRQVYESPLKVGAAIQLISNAGYGISALRRHPPGDKRDYALAGMSVLALTGNYLQSLGSKGRGLALDDICSAAASAIEADKTLQKSDKEGLRQRIDKLADALSKQPEVIHSPRALKQAITERLNYYRAWHPGAPAPAAEFFPKETQFLKKSPFMSPTIAHQMTRVAGDSSPLL